MRKKFINVFCEKDRDALLAKGFTLITSDANGKLYTFEYDDDIIKLMFDNNETLPEVSVLSDTLHF